MKNWIKKYWIYLLVLAQPALDVLAYFQYDSAIGTMAGYIRLCLLVVVPLVVLSTTKNKKSFIILMGIIGTYCLLHVVNGVLHGHGVFADLSYMLKVVQMPVLGISFCYLLKNEKQKENINKSFVINFGIIVLIMVVAHISGTGTHTYDIYKIGYMGWFANANAQSIIIVTLAPFLIYMAIKSGKRLSSVLAMIIAVCVLLANGTKAGYLAVLGILVGISFYYILEGVIFRRVLNRGKVNVCMIVIPIILSFIAVAVYPITPRYQMDTYSSGKREEENVKLNKKKEKISKEDSKLTLEEILADPIKKAELIEIYEGELDEELVKEFGVEPVLEKYGWWPDSYILADVRLKKRIYAELVWENSDMATHVFGINFEKMSKSDLENDYAAIYYYYGYLGMSLYLAFLAYFCILILRTLLKNFKESYNLYNFIIALVYILQLGLAQFSGAILRRPNASIYMSLIVALIYYQCKSIEEKSSCLNREC